jgi:hypothetical protein
MKTKTFRLQELFESLDDFRDSCSQREQHIAWGFDTPEDAWNANPQVEWVDARREALAGRFAAQA